MKGNMLRWMKDYLSDRMQKVILNGKSSSWKKITAGVPQGSVLGPLCFLVYINDIVENINSHLFLFADDASLFRTVDEVSLHEDTRLLNEDLNRISLWANQQKIIISLPKTIAMIFSRKKQPPQKLPLILNNNRLKNVKQHKHLGITFTQNMQWTTHIDNIVSSATTRIHLMKIVKYKWSRNSLLICYTNFIRPLIEYANVVYANLSIQDSNKLVKHTK